MSRIASIIRDRRQKKGGLKKPPLALATLIDTISHNVASTPSHDAEVLTELLEFWADDPTEFQDHCLTAVTELKDNTGKFTALESPVFLARVEGGFALLHSFLEIPATLSEQCPGVTATVGEITDRVTLLSRPANDFFRPRSIATKLPTWRSATTTSKSTALLNTNHEARAPRYRSSP